MRSLQQAAYADMFPTLFLLLVNATASTAGFNSMTARKKCDIQCKVNRHNHKFKSTQPTVKFS
jgi:hypothetical protein